MKLKKLAVALGAVVALGAGGMAAGAAEASASTAVSPYIIHPVSKSLPVHTAGTACTEAVSESHAAARTKWNTGILCLPYITKRGATAYHWTYALDKGDGFLYTTDCKQLTVAADGTISLVALTC